VQYWRYRLIPIQAPLSLGVKMAKSGFLLNLRGSSSICVVALAVSRTAEDHLS